MNLVIMKGRLARDLDVRMTQSGRQVARFTVAVDRTKAKDGQQTADFVPCIAWEKTAEFAEKYLSKGQRILVEGRITTGSYEKDGVKKYTTDVTCDRIEFADGGRRQNREEEDDIPIDIPM